jgi:lysophospholipase L1-like esterase
VDIAEIRFNRAGPPSDSEAVCDERRSPNGDFVKKEQTTFIWVVSCFFVLTGLCLNQWVLHPLLLLEDGKQSVLRLLVVWVYDISAVTSGLLLLVRRNKTTLSGQTFIFSGLTLLLIGIGMELVLGAIVWMVPSLDQMLTPTFVPQALSNPQFGMIPNPRYPGHDANGFRNPVALSKADCVTIGDSFTYGYGVRDSQSWPSQFQRLSGQTVYNMSFNGYGPIEALMLMNRAVDLRPSRVIYAMFIGNDCCDAYRSVYDRNQFPEFKSHDPEVQKAIGDRDRQAPYEQIDGSRESVVPLSRNKTWIAVKRLKLCRLFFAAEVAIQSRTNNLLSSVHYFRFRDQRRIAMTRSDRFELFETPDFATILVPAPRQKAMDLDDPRIEEGLRISHQSLLEMNHAAQSHAIELVVLLIPTKERVFYEFYPAYNRVASESMSRLVKQEDEMRRRTLGFLGEQKIAYIDLLPRIQNCLAKSEQPYFKDSDNHFNAIGNEVVAKAVDEYLTRERK